MPAGLDGIDPRLLERHHLIPAVAAAGLQPEAVEPARDVARGDVVSARTRVAPFEQVVGQELDVRAHLLGTDRRFGRRLGERGSGDGGEQQRGKAMAHKENSLRAGAIDDQVSSMNLPGARPRATNCTPPLGAQRSSFG